MMSQVNVAIIALGLLLVIAATGIIMHGWVRPLLAKAPIVDLSAAGRKRRKRPTIDRGAASAKTRCVDRH
jgi:hypothetical protein